MHHEQGTTHCRHSVADPGWMCSMGSSRSKDAIQRCPSPRRNSRNLGSSSLSEGRTEVVNCLQDRSLYLLCVIRGTDGEDLRAASGLPSCANRPVHGDGRLSKACRQVTGRDETAVARDFEVRRVGSGRNTAVYGKDGR